MKSRALLLEEYQKILQLYLIGLKTNNLFQDFVCKHSKFNNLICIKHSIMCMLLVDCPGLCNPEKGCCWL